MPLLQALSLPKSAVPAPNSRTTAISISADRERFSAFDVPASPLQQQWYRNHYWKEGDLAGLLYAHYAPADELQSPMPVKS